MNYPDKNLGQCLVVIRIQYISRMCSSLVTLPDSKYWSSWSLSLRIGSIISWTRQYP